MYVFFMYFFISLMFSSILILLRIFLSWISIEFYVVFFSASWDNHRDEQIFWWWKQIYIFDWNNQQVLSLSLSLFLTHTHTHTHTYTDTLSLLTFCLNMLICVQK